jgi:lipopolysaccharide/colanic/teichoic acid biosynthesis glycosyltransferase
MKATPAELTCFEDMIRLDCSYVDTLSLRKDLALLARTVPALLTARGAN